MNMHGVDWAIVAGLLLVLVAAALSTARYARSVSGFLAAERCGRRYLIALANAMAATDVITLVYWFELHYETGFSGVWWNLMTEPALVVIALSGWVVYRFRRTRAMTLAQFFEMRYSRRFRVFAGIVAYLAGIVNFGIFPAVGARVFIALCGLPERFAVAGLEVSTFAALMAGLISIALLFTFVGGQIAVMVTDFLQGVFANAVFVAVLIFLLWLFPWDEVAQVLSEPGSEGLVHPFRGARSSEFDLWYFLIAVFVAFYTFMGWQGTQGYQCCASTPHEAKMAGVLYGWRFRVLLLVTVVAPIAVHTLLAHPEHAAQAEALRQSLESVVAETPEETGTLRSQLRTPAALAVLLPPGLLGLFCAALLAAFISTHDTYLHSWGSIFVQDVVLPFRRRPLGTRRHLWLLRLSILGVAVFIYVFSLLVRQTQFIAMFTAITGAVFVAGAGAALIGGLYWKRATAAGAWAAMITGMTVAAGGIVAQQLEAEVFADMPRGLEWLGPPGLFLKVGLTGQELTFLACVLAVAAYVFVSLVTPDPRLDLDRLLHRGAHAVAGEGGPAERRARGFWERLGIDPEFSGRDRIVAAVSVGWPLLWTALFLAVTAWNLVAEWPQAWWVRFWHVWTHVFLVGAAAVTVWFSVGGFRDLAYLFAQLRERRPDPADDRRVDHEEFRR